MADQFVKLTIENKDRAGEGFVAQFNPERYALEKAANWEGADRRGTLQYGGAGRKSITLELFFDTYDSGQDVRDVYVRKLIALMEPTIATSGGKKRPPILLIGWGGFAFNCVLERLAQNYVMFDKDGKPLRAVVNATFKQFSTAEEDARSNPSGDPTKTHVVRQGETISLISWQEYGDAGLWRIIADGNRIENPRDLEVGVRLAIPPLL